MEELDLIGAIAVFFDLCVDGSDYDGRELGDISYMSVDGIRVVFSVGDEGVCIDFVMWDDLVRMESGVVIDFRYFSFDHVVEVMLSILGNFREGRNNFS